MQQKTTFIVALFVTFFGVRASGQDQAPTRLLQGYHRTVNGPLLWEIVPDYQGSFRGIPFRTNQWGMHDKPYTLAKPRNAYRIALLGSSITVGAGVPDDATMEAVLEAKLNTEGPSTPARRYEILNFSAGAYGILQNVLVAEQKVFEFNPDAVFVGVFSVETGRMSSYLVKLVKSGYQFPDGYVQSRLKEAGVNSGMEEPELRRRVGPLSEDLVRWSYSRIAEICRQKKVAVVGLILPEPEVRFGRDINRSAKLAADAGIPLVDLRGIYDGLAADSLRLGGADPHWNVAGNRLVAERVFGILRDRDAALLKLGFASHH